MIHPTPSMPEPPSVPTINPPHIPSFSSPEGRQFVRSILRPQLPFDPHDDQLEGICQSLDGEDLVAIAATGSGKTGFFSMYMLMLRALSSNPNMCRPSRKICKDPVMVVVCPTVGLEEDMVNTGYCCQKKSTNHF